YNDDYFDNLDVLRKRVRVKIKDEKPFRNEYREILKYFYEISDLSSIYNEYINGVNKFFNGRFRLFIENLENCGILNDSLLVIFSDHGEGPCTDHFGHGAELFDGIVRVPLIMVYTDFLPEGMVINSQVRTVDIFSTILDIVIGEENFPVIISDTDSFSLLPYIFEKEGKDLPAYSEVWNHSTTQDEMDDFMNECLAAGRVLPPSYNYSIYQRSVRIPEYKCILQGDETLIDGKIDIDGSDIEFVKSLYRNILRRVEDKGGFDHWLEKLENGNLSREELIKQFKSTEEAMNINRLYDVKNDPFEINNLLNSDNISYYLPLFKKFVEIIEIINSYSNRNNADIYYSNEKERQEIEKELKNLGYLG
ncbi:hypothetical protein DRQ09_02535, partial [candidate division KSB1 bacterium]